MRSVRHVGLAESVSMIADALGWKLDRITDEIQPKMATETVASEFLAVDPGFVCGIVQDGIGYRNGLPVITLHMEAYLGAPESFDSVQIAGSPALTMKIAGGVHGDIATASIVVNSLPKILEVAPGFTRCGTCRFRRSTAGGSPSLVPRQGWEAMMDAVQSQHLGRVRHLRESFAEANERLVARLRGAIRRGGGACAGRGVVGGADRLARRGRHDAVRGTDFGRRWRGRSRCRRISASARGRRSSPRFPRGSRRRRRWRLRRASAAPDAIAALEAAGMRMARAFDSLTPERGARMGITSAVVGSITVYQIGEWATAHVIRHNRQAKRVLGEG